MSQAAGRSVEDFVVVDIETSGRTPWTGRLLRAGIGEVAHRQPRALRELKKVYAAEGVVVEHTTFDVRWALLEGAELTADVHDLRTMSWMLDEERSHRLEDLMLDLMGERIVKPIVTRNDRPAWNTDVWPIPGMRGCVPMEDVPDDIMDEYAGNDLDEEARLYERLRWDLDAAGLWELFLRDEVPLTAELALMEATGLPFDEAACEELRAAVQGEADELGAKLVRMAGVPLNLGSPAQVAKYLFTRKGGEVALKGVLPLDDRMRAAIDGVPRKGPDDEDDPRALKLERGRGSARAVPRNFRPTKVGRDYVHGLWIGRGRGLRAAESGFGSSKHWSEAKKEHKQPSTSSVSLVLANPEDDFVADLVYWRELDKLAGSFLSKFPTYSRDGRLYGTFARTGTVTGRFSSSEPNLQNIPAHGTYGSLVRGLFRGPLVVGDYAQLEQRVATHFCQDPAMLRAYRDDIDLYGLAAATLFGGEPSKKHEQRGLMKTGMLGLQYGSGAGKLAQLIMIDDSATLEFNVTGSQARATGVAGQVTDEMKAKAKELIDQLHDVFPVFFAWREDVIAQAVADGGITTIAGRKRHLTFPDGWLKRRKRAWQWYSEEEASRGFALERQALSSLCSGSAADLVAGAMVAVSWSMVDAVALCVQVHDEMVWERLDGWRSDMLPELKELCETGHGYELAVPIVFEVKEADSWSKDDVVGQNAHGLFVDRMKRQRSEGLQSRKASDLARRRKEERTK